MAIAGVAQEDYRYAAAQRRRFLEGRFEDALTERAGESGGASFFMS